MAEIRTVTTLRRKREEIKRAIRNYEKRLDQARADLAHLTAALALFEARGGDESLPAYYDLHRLFRYAEGIKLCREALEAGPRTTREIAAYIAKAKGLDAGDAVLRKVLCSKIIHQLRRQHRQGRILIDGKRQAAIIWRLPDVEDRPQLAL